MSGAATGPEGSGLAVEEVRVAMALNGGVSLAVWMGGCAVELDCARRADLGPEPIEGFPARTIYNAVCSAFARRLVVDVMSGSSAGGINGALLAAAIVHRRRLHPDYLRDRWLELGDFGKLLRPLTEVDPYSLMDGADFFDKLLATFRAVSGDDPEPRNSPPAPPPAPDPAPALDVTTTDVLGAGRRFADAWGGEITALDYRARFRFRAHADYTAENLAVAARSSASFPVAFEPFVVSHCDALRLAGFDEPRAVIDGGLLDNAPIAAAIDLIKARPADERQVRRYLCYVNGEPKDVTEREKPRPGETAEQLAHREQNPRLPKVIANVLGLPRKAPFADQLRALDEATWRGSPTQSAELALLGLDDATLFDTASALLGVYRSRRRMASLRELLEPADARAHWVARTALPWIPPAELEAPAEGRWGWGVQAARRVHHLMADLVREAIRTGDPANHPALLRARATIDAQIALAERRRRERAGSFEAAEDASTAADDAALRGEVLESATAVHSVRGLLGSQEGVVVGAALFGPGWEGPQLTPEMETAFLRRVLSIEVVRRAFAIERDIDDGQPFAFAQLTPAAPTPLLDERPLSEAGPRSPETKLTGIRLAHFSAFHRRSWRANDFMWGRLDGAARVIDMLVDAGRTIDVQSTAPWVPLAVALTPEGDGPFAVAQRALVEEALDDLDAGSPPGSDDLRARLTAALHHDLARRDDLSARGRLTRAVCGRAAQLEILAHELPTLIDEAQTDSAGGASTPPLSLAPDDLLGAVRALRDQDPLPEQLGRDATPEVVSDMALRTVSRSGLVTLALLRASTLPLTGPLMLLRAPLLSVAGMVARSHRWRPVVLLAYAAAALFLTVRAAAVNPASSDLEGVSRDASVLSIVALLTVVGLLLVPLLRAWGRRSGDRWVHALVALVALAGVAVSAVLAGMRGDRTLADVAGAGGFSPPGWVFWLPFALVLLSAPLMLRRWIQAPWSPIAGPLLAVGGSLAVGGWSAYRLIVPEDARRHLPWWAIACLIVSVAVVAGYVVAQPRLVRVARRGLARVTDLRAGVRARG